MAQNNWKKIPILFRRKVEKCKKPTFLQLPAPANNEQSRQVPVKFSFNYTKVSNQGWLESESTNF
jgi:hypothetical protein